MKFGVNTFVWVSPCTTEAIRDLAPKVRSMGFDILEISVENPALIDVAEVKEILAKNQLETVMCGAFGLDRNLCSTNPEFRENARQYILWLIDAAAELGADTVSGPMYSAVGKDHIEDLNERQAEWKRAVAGVQEMAAVAQKKNVRLALETLNRFETDMLNIVDQGLRFIEETGMNNVGLHLDTFHMNIEERSLGDAIRAAGRRLHHLHACENDRGAPGSGHVPWVSIGDQPSTKPIR